MGRFQRHTVLLWSISSCSRGEALSVSSGSSAMSRDSGISAGNRRTFSSNRSNIEVIQRSPNHTRGRTPWVAYSGGRARSEEHTSELQSRGHLVCRRLLEKQKRPLRPMADDDGEEG